jgi:hypothetical protein
LLSRNAICGAAGLALAIVYYRLADELPRSLLADPIGADGLPKLLATMLGLLSAILLVGALVRPRVPGKSTSIATHLRSAGMLALGIFYFFALPWLGYLLTMAVFLLAVTLYAGLRPGVQPVLVSLAGAVVLWGTFVHVFRISMPPGVWHIG